MCAEKTLLKIAGVALTALVFTSLPAGAQEPAPYSGPQAGAPGVPLPGDFAQPAQQAQAAVKPEVAPMPQRVTAVRPELMEEVLRRQDELTLLEMDVKKAELESRLKEIESKDKEATQAAAPPVAPMMPVSAPSMSSLAPMLESLGVSSGSDIGGGEPVVTRISRQGGSLVARIEIPGNGVMSVHSGSTLPGSWKITSITADRVMAKRGKGKEQVLSFKSVDTAGGSEGAMGSPSIPYAMPSMPIGQP